MEASVTTSESIDQLAPALVSLQYALPSFDKDSTGYGYKYANLAGVVKAAKQLLKDNDLAISQHVGLFNGDSASVTTILLHKSGQFMKSVASIPVIEMKGTNAAQNYGASLSYLRRYAYISILGGATEDNDAVGDTKGQQIGTSFEKPKATAPTTNTEAVNRPRFAKRQQTTTASEHEI